MIAVFLLGAAALLLLHGLFYSRAWIRALSVRVLFSSPHICAGELCELTEVIENRKKMAVPIVEIGFRLPRGLHFEDAENILESDYVYKRDIFAIRGMERIVRRYHVTALKRGFYAVSQLTCHAPSRLFARMYMMDRKAQDGDAGLYVYAANVDCSLLLRAVEVILGERESARRIFEDPFVFSSIRPYTIQDPMKTVNWKATAKTGELMVNTYASTAAVRVRIYLDVSTDEGVTFSDSFREFGIAIAASLIRSLVKAQMDASLVMNCLREKIHLPDSAKSGAFPGRTADCVRFPSCLGAAKMTAMEEYLTRDFDSAPVLPFEEMIRREARMRTDPASDNEVSVFLTCMDRPSLRDSIQALLGPNRSGILAVLSRTADRRREEHVRNLHVLPLCDVR